MVDAVSVEAARAFWAESERQLYPTAVSDMHRYQQTIIAVRALANALRPAASMEQLMALWPRAGEMFEAALSAQDLSVASLPQAQITGSAFALREREIKHELRRQAQLDRISAAHEAGHAWVVLGESGKIGAGLANPYCCTEMHMASGFSLVSQVQADPQRGAPIFVVSVIKLDPASGALLDAEPGIEPEAQHERPEDFVAHRDAVRGRIHARTVEDAH